MPSRGLAFILVLLIWSAIYLPGLGSLPIKGEEGRRILPAVSMIESGNYLVPEVGGATYFSKPPLINWLIAGSFKLFGVRNEWTARLPSAIAILVVGVAFVMVARTALSPLGSLFAAVIWLTSAGIIEKGRLAEIEALYVSLAALAIICWLTFWRTNRSPWLVWIPASIFLGLGLLAKGPVHLIFFYAIVISVAWSDRNWRVMLHPAHFVGVLLMLGIFAAWAVPFLHATSGSVAATKWSSQFSGRLTGRDFHFASWILNIPKGFVYFLPWTLFLLLVRPSRLIEARDRPLALALIWGAAIPFVLVNLIPGSLPRYSMPGLIPVTWLLAMILVQRELEWPGWLGGWSFSIRFRQRIIAAIAITIVAGVAIYALAVVPKLQQRQNLKRLAAQIDLTIPPNESLYALDPNYQPIFFYVHTKLIYVGQFTDFPADVKFLLARPDRVQEILASDRWNPRRARIMFKVTDYRNQSLIVFKIE